MQARINSLILAFLVISAAVSAAQEDVNSGENQGEQALPSFPFVAEIVADDVYIRSGPGTNYYHCVKLNQADRVEVVGSKFGWSQIVPPAGSFSWISKQYVDIAAKNKNAGIVTGDNVRVWAGSDSVRPVHSSSLQLKLDTGAEVTLLAEELEGYYKIAPPRGSYLWVSSRYVRPLGPIGRIPLDVESKAKPAIDTDRAVTGGAGVEAEKLEEYYALEKKLQAERSKPIMRQFYFDIKEGLFKIATDKNAGKAGRYARFALEQVGSCELALAVAKELKIHEVELQETQKRIEKARAARLAQVRDLGKFTVIGKLQTSSIFDSEAGLKYYRIVDDSGRTVCYACPDGAIGNSDFSGLIDRRVGLVGTLLPHRETAGALVRFTEIVELE